MTTVWIASSAVKKVARETHKQFPSESGGILLGYRASNKEVVVTKAVGPGPNAKHFADEFIPDHTYHDREVERHYHETDRKEVYLGDWHSHPSSHPYLSPTDRETLKCISQHSGSRIRRPLMLILGNVEGWQVATWEYVPIGFRSLHFAFSRQCGIKIYE